VTNAPTKAKVGTNFTNPNPTVNGSTASNPTVTDWLRIYRNGNVYTPYVSLDNKDWVKGAAWSLTAANHYPIKIHLFAFSGGPANTIPAYFDYVHVYSQP